MRRLLAILTLCLHLPLLMGAPQLQDSITVSLVTCWPGPEVYELCGHEAVRVRGVYRGAEIDSVWNYGTFDFNQPNFIYRFVKGETDYKLSSYPFAWFMPEYVAGGRMVVEQDLNLTQAEAGRMLELLRHEALPPNSTYRYNYVKDNCATRVVDRLDQAVGTPVVYPDSIHYGTFRREMRAYHKDYPWYQFGIDLALGSGLDYPLRGKEEMFVPLEMMRKAGNAHLADGRPLVRETRVLNEGVPDATLGPTAWWAVPLTCSWAFFALVMLLCLWQWKCGRIFRALYCVWFAILGLTGCLLTFLIFVSTHEATSPNILLLWLNPLQLVIATGVWFRNKMRAATVAMIYVNIILITILLIVWPLHAQSANPAFFPLMGATLALAVAYAIIRTQISSKNIDIRYKNEEVGNLGARRNSRTVGSRSKGARKAPARGRNNR